MDDARFDHLARALTQLAPRRKVVGVLLGVALGGRLVEASAGTRSRPGSQKSRQRHRDRGKPGAEALPATCYPGTSCTPGPGKVAKSCDFAHSTVFHNLNARGAILSKSDFTGADLRGADLRGANLGGSCFVDADLSGAQLGVSVNLQKAIFCRTMMPDGSINNSGCNDATTCCPTCTRLGDACDANTICCDGTCIAGFCVKTCSGPPSCFTGSGGCGTGACVKSASGPLVCQYGIIQGADCTTDQECAEAGGPGSICAVETGSDPICSGYAHVCSGSPPQ